MNLCCWRQRHGREWRSQHSHQYWICCQWWGTKDATMSSIQTSVRTMTLVLTSPWLTIAWQKQSQCVRYDIIVSQTTNIIQEMSGVAGVTTRWVSCSCHSPWHMDMCYPRCCEPLADVVSPNQSIADILVEYLTTVKMTIGMTRWRVTNPATCLVTWVSIRCDTHLSISNCHHVMNVVHHCCLFTSSH